MNEENFITEFRKIREDKGISKAELSRKTGVTLSTINKLEVNDRTYQDGVKILNYLKTL
jgi:transcriptional regulator with XRE-family HTH domain